MLVSHTTNMAGKLNTMAKLCCEGGEIPQTSFPLMDDKTNNIIPPTPTIIDISSITQHTTAPCQIKLWETHLLLPWVSIFLTKDYMDDSHLLWLLPRVAQANHLCHQLPHQNHHSNSPRTSQSMPARIALNQSNY